MTNKLSWCAAFIGLLSLTATLTACNNEEEVVPLNDRNVTARHYKMPDPVLLSADEAAEVQAIRDEYREATN